MTYDELWDWLNIDLPALGRPYHPELTPSQRMSRYNSEQRGETYEEWKEWYFNNIESNGKE